MRLRGIAYGLVLSAALAVPAAAVEPDAPEQLITRLDAVGIEVQKRLAAKFRATTDYEKNDKGALVEFYSDHGNAAVWVDADGLNARARLAIKELARAGDYGLNADDYPIPAIERTAGTIPAATLAEAELTLSRSVLAYVRHARGGRFEPGMFSTAILDPTLDLPDPLKVMEQVAVLDDPAPYMRGFQPKQPQFEALRQVYLKLRGGSQEKQIVIPEGPVIKPGESHKQVMLVRKRLRVAAADGEGKAKPELYDPKLEAAVKEFQKSRGLNAEGIIGPATRRAMNSRPKNRIKTILANMERWRWISTDPDAFQVQANVPEFTIRVLEKGKPVFTERMVVGKVDKATPIFSDQMEYVEFHPYWNVPPSIAREEILPNVRRRTLADGWFGAFSNWNSRFLARYNLEVKYNGRRVDPSSVNWGNVDVSRLSFYQPPGKDNVLGFVKFMFPNKHTVYMHDTPSRHLFNQPVRAYSHGCMRIRDPRKFAEILLGHDAGWTPGRVNSAIEGKQNLPVRLKDPIPVHITYFTARVQPDGQVRYFGDLYGHDARIARLFK